MLWFCRVLKAVFWLNHLVVTSLLALGSFLINAFSFLMLTWTPFQKLHCRMGYWVIILQQLLQLPQILRCHLA